jgi:predicted nucleic acid-binding protein
VRVFLDANVLFSAAYRAQGVARALFHQAETGSCTLVCSPHAIEEARRNIAARYPDRLGDLTGLVARLETCPEPRPAAIAAAAAEGLPPKDAPILAAALQAGCHVLVTGDRADFGRVFGRRIGGTVVMLPAEALELILE